LKLTKSNLKTLPVPEKGYQIHWDDELPSFGVRITERGAKSFILQRRIKGKSQRITICKTREMAPEGARNEARKLIGDIIKGGDPVAEKRKKRLKGKTVDEVLTDYLDSKNLKPRTQKDMRVVMERYLKTWMKKSLLSITPDMVLRKHKEIGEKSKAQANLAMKYLRAIFSLAMIQYTDSEGKPIITANPVKRLSDLKRWYRVERRQTIIKPNQLEPWFKAVLNQPENTREYFLTLLFTGLRSGEAATMRVDQVDLESKIFTVLDTKNHQSHTLPLSDYLLEIFKRRLNNCPGDYVFHGRHGEGHLLSTDSAVRLVKEESGVNFCRHDLRRTFATIAESLDIPAYALKRLLNHAMPDVTAGYIVVDIERLRKPMQEITDFILTAAGQMESASMTEIDKQAVGQTT
jgi:integrase